MLTYGSVCSGIEAASTAWEPLGFRANWFSEIEAFPSAVLAHHWPEVMNLGDMTKIAAAVRAGDVSAPDLLVGGTPCQAFSVAGARAGLSDPRGQLTISYVELADAIDQQRRAAGQQPAIIVWENVPGVLSSKDNAFGAFLGLLSGEECELEPPGKKWANAGYVSGPKRAIAWRVLDAQYFGVAQRRRRVFVVASARTDFDPSKVLFEREGVRRDTPPSRSAGSSTAALTANGVGTCGADDNQAQAGHLVAAFGGGNCSGAIEVAACLTARGQRIDFQVETFLAQFSSTGQGAWTEGAGTLRAREQESHEHLAVMAHAFDARQSDVIQYGDFTGPLDTNSFTIGVLAYGFQQRIARNGRDDMGDICHTLSAEAGETGKGDSAPCVAIAFSSKDHGQDAAEELSPTLRAAGHSDSHANAGAPPAVAYGIPGNWIGRAPENGGNATEPMFDVAPCLTVADRHGVAYPILEVGKRTGSSTTDTRAGLGIGSGDDPMFTLQAGAQHGVAAFAENSRAEVRLEGGDGQITGALSGGGGKVGQGYPAAVVDMAVRRLTPVECERLQGFPDNHTLIPGKKLNRLVEDELAYLREHFPDMSEAEANRLAADGPRYKAIGNSMAVPVMAWIGLRIKQQLEGTV